MTGLLLLVAGCASQGYRNEAGGYTLYRSRMMSPQGGATDEELVRMYPCRDGDTVHSLLNAYDAWQP